LAKLRRQALDIFGCLEVHMRIAMNRIALPMLDNGDAIFDHRRCVIDVTGAQKAR
jgi:hypothetical protein